MTVWCFQCRIDYEDEVDTCIECTAPTIERSPLAPHEVGSGDDEQLAYEFNTWPIPARTRLDADLWTANLAHSWMGGSLIVCSDDEEAVDAIIDVIDDELNPTFEAGAGLVEYALDDYPVEARERIMHMVDLSGVPYKIDDKHLLLVQEKHETEIDDLFERLASEAPERLTFGPGIDGVDPLVVVQDVFVAADKLRRNATDSRARRAFIGASDDAYEIKLPWGYDSRFWRGVLDHCDELNDALEADERDDVKDIAKTISDALRTVL